MSRILLRGGCVLTMGRANHVQADVLVEDGRIAEIGTGLRSRSAEVVDASATVVMPGMVDAHRHVAAALFRNLGRPGDASRLRDPQDVYAATLLGLTSALAAGITTIVDWCEPAAEPRLLEAALEAHRDSGIRSVVVGGDPGSTAPTGPLQTRAAAVPDRLDPASWEAARRAGLRVHAHLLSGDGTMTVPALAAAGLLGPDVTLVHGTGLGEPDLATLAGADAALVLTPAADMAAGLPAAPLQGIIDHGLRPGLGVDHEHLSPGDVFIQMRAVISLQHATVFDRKLAGKAGLPRLLTTREVIRYATVDGARAAGLGGEVGRLEPGMQADLVVLRTDRPNVHPTNDPIGAVVWGMDTSNVDWVFVAGRAVVRDGEIQGDRGRVRTLALAAHDRVGTG